MVGARGDDATVAVSPHAGYGEYVATKGEGMAPAELSWLRTFYAKLRDKRARVRPPTYRRNPASRTRAASPFGRESTVTTTCSSGATNTPISQRRGARSRGCPARCHDSQASSPHSMHSSLHAVRSKTNGDENVTRLVRFRLLAWKSEYLTAGVNSSRSGTIFVVPYLRMVAGRVTVGHRCSHHTVSIRAVGAPRNSAGTTVTATVRTVTPARTPRADSSVAAASYSRGAVMPDARCMDHQAAQASIRAPGVFCSASVDATGLNGCRLITTRGHDY